MTTSPAPTPAGAAAVGQVLQITNLSKRFGAVSAVDALSFTVQPGRVTGFLGPNGAGKTTTLRMLLGLVNPTSGTATIGGVTYRDLSHPFATVGAALEAASFHPGRTARDHLRVQAAGAGVSTARIGEVLELTGMSSYADRRVGGYSMGMRQRLGLASALLGDPGVLILDEPTNGLDPEGIRWIRELLRGLAAQGRTVLISSHLLSEVQQIVEDVVIIARGRMVRAGVLSQIEAERPARVRVDSPNREALGACLAGAGFAGVREASGALLLDGTPAAVGRAAFAGGVELSLLAPVAGGLEDLFLELTGDPR